MEFWGAEVKPGQILKVQPGDEKVLHLSQASLGEVKKDKNESVFLYVKVDGEKLVVGTLSADKCTHITYDLVFEKEFELFHTGKSGSVYFCGYKSVLGDDESNEFSDSEFDSDEDNLLEVMENGKAEAKDEVKPKANATKPDSKKVKIEEPKKDKKPKEDEDEDEDDDEDDEDDDDSDASDDEDMLDGEDESDDEDDESSEEDEETPKKVQQGKKRPAESASKATPADKKAKLVTPQKKGADAKKGIAHVSTPHPSKGAKTPATTDKSKPQTPKSGGQVQCKSCTKTFGSEKGLESHSKAKHSAGK